MHDNPARAAVAYFLIAGLAALAVLGITISRPSDPHSQFLLGLSLSRLVMAAAFVIAAVMSMALAWHSWRRPVMVTGWLRSHLSRDGWLRILVDSSASVFLVGLAVVCFRDWLPIPPRALSHLQPAVLWVMIVAALNVISSVVLHDADHSGWPLPAMQADPTDGSTSFLRDFIVGCLIVLLCTILLLIVNLLVGVLVKDHMNAAMVMLVRPSIPRGNFRPEQVERTRYVVSALLFPILAFLSWILAGKLQRGVPRSTNRVGAVTMLSLAAGLALWLYFSLREVDFLYLRFLYANLHLGPVIALYGAFLVLICVERRYLSRIGLKKALDLAAVLVGVLAGLAVISACLRTSADEYAYTEHFNAYFYSIVQVTLGKTLLVDLTNQYGLYPYFLEPLFHLIGVDVPQLTLTMGILLLGIFLILLSLLVQLARSRLIALCGFVAIACVWLSAPDTRSTEPYFQYWPHRLIFPVILLLLAFLHQGSQGKRKRTVYYALAFLACGAGMLWNFDTGVITFAVWVLYLCWDTLLDWRATGARRSAIVIAVHSAKAFATLLATLGLLLLYTYARSGKLPDLAALGFYQSIFYQSGYYMRPMPLFHPWNLVALTYMAGLCLCAGFLLQRLQGIGLPEDTDNRSWVNMVFLVSVMGVGLFTVYQGRSHDRNLGATFWSVFFLLALFADALMDRIVGNASIVEAPRVRIRRLAMLSLPLCLLFVLFAYVPAFFVLMPTTLRGLQAQLGAIRDIGQGLPNAYTDRLELMTRYFHPGAETPIFSARYNTVYYIETRTKNPVHAPGWNELILEGDVRRYEDYLARNDPEVLLVSDEFAGAFPDLYLTIREDYVEVGREGDLALFKWRLAAR